MRARGAMGRGKSWERAMLGRWDGCKWPFVSKPQRRERQGEALDGVTGTRSRARQLRRRWDTRPPERARRLAGTLSDGVGRGRRRDAATPAPRPGCPATGAAGARHGDGRTALERVPTWRVHKLRSGMMPSWAVPRRTGRALPLHRMRVAALRSGPGLWRMRGMLGDNACCAAA